MKLTWGWSPTIRLFVLQVKQKIIIHPWRWTSSPAISHLNVTRWEVWGLRFLSNELWCLVGGLRCEVGMKCDTNREAASSDDSHIILTFYLSEKDLWWGCCYCSALVFLHCMLVRWQDWTDCCHFWLTVRLSQWSQLPHLTASCSTSSFLTFPPPQTADGERPGRPQFLSPCRLTNLTLQKLDAAIRIKILSQ